MEMQDTKGKIIKETFPSESVSIIGDILAGIILSLLIIPFDSFIALILIIPALLSLRGNLSGPFIARTSRDLIIGNFSKRSWIENTLATFLLAMITAVIIGIFSILLNFLFFNLTELTVVQYFAIPSVSIILTLCISIPCSTGLNYFAFKRGLNPNNVVNPVMTAIDDFFTVFCFFLTLLMLGVP
ncbi:MAG: magnesium transporter [Candidatus Lokiarchaeota archaeon]|nr:magnesium transporter [Candidatus Lokiarchaeota archaeon]